MPFLASTTTILLSVVLCAGLTMGLGVAPTATAVVAAIAISVAAIALVGFMTARTPAALRAFPGAPPALAISTGTGSSSWAQARARALVPARRSLAWR